MWFKIIFLLAMTHCLCQYIVKEADRDCNPTSRATHTVSASIQMSFVGERQMILSHKIRIYQNREQEQFLKKSCGVVRFSYNWGLAEWLNQYKNGGKPNPLKLKKQFNGIKQVEFPFLYEVSKCCSETAFANLARSCK